MNLASSLSPENVASYLNRDANKDEDKYRMGKKHRKLILWFVYYLTVSREPTTAAPPCVVVFDYIYAQSTVL